jgi:hypothetical protein
VHIDRDDRSAKFWLNPVGLAVNLGFSASNWRGSNTWYNPSGRRCCEAGMTTSDPKPGERIIDVRVDEYSLSADLADGRTITVPLAWFPRLLHASAQQRSNWQIAGGGFGIHWPEVDEDLSVQGLLRGAPAAAERSGAA